MEQGDCVYQSTDVGLLKLADVSARLNMSQRTIYRLTREGVLPPAIHFGRRIVRWPKKAMVEYLQGLEGRKDGLCPFVK